ncbi:MAG: DUF2029 domain-containing protein [bacterium]|nr:DUF2029 domain-containing protein [bacterium]
MDKKDKMDIVDRVVTGKRPFSSGRYFYLIFFGVLIEGGLILYRLIETAPAQTVIKYMVIFSVTFGLTAAAYLLLKKKTGSTPSFTKRELLTVLVFAFIFQLTLLPSAPEMSDDIYRYIWDGKLQAHHINPYTYAPDDPALSHLHSEILPRLVNFPHIKTIYPPAAQLLFRLSYLLSGESITGLKALFTLFQLASCLLFYLILRQRNQHPALLLTFAWNPLVIMETSLNGHLDILMVFFLLLSLALLDKNHTSLSAIALACAVLAKLIPIVLMPLYLKRCLRRPSGGPCAGSAKGWRRHVCPPLEPRYASQSTPSHGGSDSRSWKEGFKVIGLFLFLFSMTIAVFYALFFESAGNMFLTALNYSSKWYFNNPLFHIIHYLTGSNPLAHLVSFSLFSVFFLFVFFGSLSFEKKIFYVALGFILLNPTIHPWYLILAVSLLCIHFNWEVFLWSGLVILSYTVVYQFKLTGVWQDSPIQLALQYTPLLVLIIKKPSGEKEKMKRLVVLVYQ